MKKTVLLLFALSVITFGCADYAEDTMPDPVNPTITIDDSKGAEGEGAKSVKKKKLITRLDR